MLHYAAFLIWAVPLGISSGFLLYAVMSTLFTAAAQVRGPVRTVNGTIISIYGFVLGAFLSTVFLSKQYQETEGNGFITEIRPTVFLTIILLETAAGFILRYMRSRLLLKRGIP